jgi:hypothetical protein
MVSEFQECEPLLLLAPRAGTSPCFCYWTSWSELVEHIATGTEVRCLLLALNCTGQSRELVQAQDLARIVNARISTDLAAVEAER